MFFGCFIIYFLNYFSSGNKLAKTFDVSLAAVSLKTSDGCTLSNAQDATGTYQFQNSSTTFTPVLKSVSDELKALITTTCICRKTFRRMLFNSHGVNDSETGQWERKIQEAGLSATRTQMSLPISRNLSSTTDLGACSLIGLADNCNGAPLKVNQSYEILLMFKSETGTNPIVTENATISSFVLSYIDANGIPAPHAFPTRCGFITDDISTTNLSWQDTDLSYQQTLNKSAKVFMSATYSCSYGSGETPHYGEFRLNEGTYNSQEVRRYFSRTNVGLTPAGTGSKTFKMQYQPTTALTDIKVINPSLRSIVLASAAVPPTQSKEIVFDTIITNLIELSSEQGDSLGKLIIAHKLESPSNGPVDGTTSTYTADSNFSGSGSVIGGGKVVYIGTGNSVAVNGLSYKMVYYFEIYEYNFSGSYIDYNITTATDNPSSVVSALEPGMILGLLFIGVALLRKHI